MDLEFHFDRAKFESHLLSGRILSGCQDFAPQHANGISQWHRFHALNSLALWIPRSSLSWHSICANKKRFVKKIKISHRSLKPAKSARQPVQKSGANGRNGRTSPFRGEVGKVCNRRYLAVGACVGEGPESHPMKPFAARRDHPTALDPSPTAQVDPLPTTAGVVDGFGSCPHCRH
jgi:hypothetical protein